MSQREMQLDDTTTLVIGHDPVLGNFFAQLWLDGKPAARTVEDLSHEDDLVDAVPGLLASNGVRELTEDEIADVGEHAIRAEGGPKAAMLDLLSGSDVDAATIYSDEDGPYGVMPLTDQEGGITHLFWGD